MRNILLRVLCLLFIVVFLGKEANSQTTISLFVAIDGRDSNPGTLSKPIASIEKALDIINTIKDKSEAIIYLRKGYYSYRKTIIIEGRTDYKLTICNYNDEKVIISGGIEILSTGFKKLQNISILNRLHKEAQNHVLELDMSVLKIDDFGQIKQHGFKKIESSGLELFVDNEPMTLARWPNIESLLIGNVIDKGSIARNGETENRGALFQYNFNMPSRWQSVKDIWMKGSFSNGFSDDNLQVENIDYNKRTIKTIQGSQYGVNSSYETDKNDHLKAYRNFYFYNVLEELDSPGEWFLDQNTKKLYLYPLRDINKASISASLMNTPLMSLKNTQDITISGISFGYGRNMGLFLEGTRNTTIKNSDFINLGTVAISACNLLLPDKTDYTSFMRNNDKSDNANLTIQFCKIKNTGTGGIILSGGNRSTLTPAKNSIENCEISDYNRHNSFSCPGVHLSGVGNKISNCYIHNAKGQAIMYLGNDHEICFNHIYNVVTDINDHGAVYTGRDPSATGTVIHENFFDRIKSNHGYSVAAVYIDDGSGGIKVNSNVFYKCSSTGEFALATVHINGGSNNTLRNNYFVECDKGISMNVWSDTKWKKSMSSIDIKKKIFENVDVRSTKYQARYAHIKSAIDTVNVMKRENFVYNSLIYKVKSFNNKKDAIIEEGSFYAEREPDFVSIIKRDFTLLAPPRELLSIPGWKPIEFNKIGLKAK